MRLVFGHRARANGDVVKDLLIHDIFHALAFLTGEGRVVVEIKT